MFAKSLLKPLFLAALLMLNGCATAFLWKDYESEGRSTTSPTPTKTPWSALPVPNPTASNWYPTAS